MEIANNWYGGLIIIAIIIIVFISNVLITKVTLRLTKEMFVAAVDLNRKFLYFYRLIEDDSFAKDARIYSFKDVVSNKMTEIGNELDLRFSNLSKKTGKYGALSTALYVFVTLSAYLIVSLKAYYGVIEIGSIISVVGSVSNILNALIFLVGVISNLSLQSNYLVHFYDYVNLKNNDESELISNEEIKRPYVFEFKNVSFKYLNSNEYALDNVSFTLGDFDKTAIVGKNGAGKSTIIKLIARF